MKSETEKLEKITSAINALHSKKEKFEKETIKDLVAQLIENNYLEEADLKSTNTKLFWNLTACGSEDDGGYFTTFNSLSEAANICAFLSNEPAKSGAPYSQKNLMNAKFACFIEVDIDNSNLHSGRGRGKIDLVNKDGKSRWVCGEENPEIMGEYLFKVF